MEKVTVSKIRRDGVPIHGTFNSRCGFITAFSLIGYSAVTGGFFFTQPGLEEPGGLPSCITMALFLMIIAGSAVAILAKAIASKRKNEVALYATAHELVKLNQTQVLGKVPLDSIQQLVVRTVDKPEKGVFGQQLEVEAVFEPADFFELRLTLTFEEKGTITIADNSSYWSLRALFRLCPSLSERLVLTDETCPMERLLKQSLHEMLVQDEQCREKKQVSAVRENTHESRTCCSACGKHPEEDTTVMFYRYRMRPYCRDCFIKLFPIKD